MTQRTKKRPASTKEAAMNEAGPAGLLALKDRALEAAAEGIVIADARKPEMPLIYVNSGFERITGYSADSVLGKNCRFLQGSSTDSSAAAEIRRAIAEQRTCLVEILNYRRDGTPFWNRLSITPVYDGSGQVTHFIGVQSDITQQITAQDALRQAKNEMEAVNRRMRMELEMAAGIQQTLLPPNHQRYERAELCWRFRPCVELAGDTLNITPLDDHRIAVYVIDVSGHGVAAALLSVTLSRWLSLLPSVHSVSPPGEADPMHLDIASPATVVRRLNRQFQMIPEVPQYFTMVYGILDQHTGDFRYVSAGHPGPILIRQSGTAALLENRSFPVGLLPGADFQDSCFRLQPGDRLYIYTDGVPETADRNEEEFGTERCQSRLLEDRHLSLSQSLDSLTSALDRWRHGYPLRDDLTLLAVEYRGAS